MMQRWRDYLMGLVENGGPKPHDYPALTEWFNELAAAMRASKEAANEIRRMLDAAGDAWNTPQTIQGFVRLKPHRNAGDFEVIDRIYLYWHSPVPGLVKWDRFFHAQAAPRAVRNRKEYFKRWLEAAENRLDVVRPIQLLNVACGPTRDVAEYVEAKPASRIFCTCIDRSPVALEYAAGVCAGARNHVAFHRADAFRFSPVVAPQLIWSAGLFDYLDDRQFVHLVRRHWCQLATGGELVIGNFARQNPTRGIMEVGDWILNHRDAGELSALAARAGVPTDAIHIGSEAEGVNLFLHARKPAD
jgi:SAM-dependent methyltransferase